VLESRIAAGNGRFRGVRYGAIWDTGNAARMGRRQVPRHQLLDPVFRKGFTHREPLGLSFEAWLFHPQLADVADLLRAFPDTTVILNHVGGLLGIPPHDGNRDEVSKSRTPRSASSRNSSISTSSSAASACCIAGGFPFARRAASSEELAPPRGGPTSKRASTRSDPSAA
jgi:hypothetical protein